MIRLENGANPVHDGINSYGVSCRVSTGDAVSPGVLRRFAEALMSGTATACIAAGARDVSHVKAFIEHDTGFIHADTVGDSLDVKVEGRDGSPTAGFRLVVNSVIYGLSAAAVQAATEVSISRTLSRFGFSREDITV